MMWQPIVATYMQGGRTALMGAAREGNTDVVMLLVNRGANIDAVNNVSSLFRDVKTHNEIRAKGRRERLSNTFTRKRLPTK